MEEEKREQVEQVEDVAQPEAEPSPLDMVARDAARLVSTVGRALILTAEDVTGLMVVRADSELRRRLDLLVKAGVVKTRSQAANTLIKEGAQAKQELFEKIDRTQAQIEALQEQLRSLKTVRTGG